MTEIVLLLNAKVRHKKMDASENIMKALTHMKIFQFALWLYKTLKILEITSGISFQPKIVTYMVIVVKTYNHSYWNLIL